MYRSISISLLFSPMIASLLIALIVMPKAFAVDTYDATTGQLSIPSVIVDNLKYEDVVVTIAGVVSVGTAIPLSDISPSIRPDTFDLKRSELIIPAAIVGDTVYQNIRIIIKDVISVGTNSVVAASGFNGEWYPDTYYMLVASSLPASQETGHRLILDTAIRLWGNFGPLEYYVIGADIESTDKIKDEFCKRRELRSINDCWDPFEKYREVTVRALENKSLSGGAGLNGDAANGYHIVAGSIDWSFTNPKELGGLDFTPNGAGETPAHEYWHVVTFAHMSPLGRIYPPTWFVEGSAVYMANYAVTASLTSGVITNQSDRTISFENSFRRAMSNGLANRAEYPGFKLNDFGYEQRDASYSLGAWGVAYLLNKVDNQEALLDILLPNYQELGWEGAFKHTFGLTTEEFYNEFELFLDLDIGDQLKILPVPTFTPRT